MLSQAPYHTFQRYRSLRTHRLSAMPIVILMPHSACNCRCVMCDIWKGNKNAKQLSEEDVSGLLASLKKLGTRQVLLSGGEALLHPAFFRLCELLKSIGLHITLLSTGLTLKKNAAMVLRWVDDVIVSLDGDADTHDAIRNIQGAYAKLKEGVQVIKAMNPHFRVSGRSVIHKWNYRNWSLIIAAAKDIGLDSISFLPADVSSEAFNREAGWDKDRQGQVLVPLEEMPSLERTTEKLISTHQKDFEEHYILESPAKIRQITDYYKAVYGLNPFPARRCNAPWVSTVIEADGTVRPCFFHAAMGNIKTESLPGILNSEAARQFRKNLDISSDETCRRCVCSLSLPAYKNPVA
jgi:MoaA/NifB/PqqE/SkfB family radical SAM enzyme